MNTKGLNTKIIRTLVKKEMLDVLRDKKTVLMMLVVPLVLYPLIYIGVMQVMAQKKKRQKKKRQKKKQMMRRPMRLQLSTRQASPIMRRR